MNPATSADIERKRIEELLREPEEGFRALFDHSNDGILIADAEKKRFVIGNQTICRMLGYSPDEIKDLGVMDIHPPEDLPYVIDQFEKQARKEIDIAKDLPVVRKDGSIYYADVSAFPITLAGKTFLVGAFRDITERKRAEESLRQSEERFRVLFEQAADIILLLEITSEGIPVIRDANSASFRLLGYERDELIGRPVSVLEAAPDASKVVEERREAVLSESGKKIFEARHRCKDGTIVDFECSVTEMQTGSKTFAISVERDITERKRVEKQAKERMKELRAFYGLAELTEREGITLDKLFQEFTGILPKSWRYPEIACARIVVGESEFRTENFTESPWKQSAPVKVNGSVVGRVEVCYLEEKPEEDEGPFLKEERLLIDAIAERIGRIYERKRIEGSLQESEQRFRALFDHSNDGILIADAEKKRFVIGNQTICRMLGYSPDEIKDLGVMDIHPPEDLPYVIDQFEKQARKEIDIAKDLPVVRKDGSIYYADVSAFPITLAGKTFLVGAFRDVTERRQAEAERERLIAELQEAATHVKTLSGLLPICASCKKIRDDKGYWNQIEVYIRDHSQVDFSHSICPDCAQKLYPEVYGKMMSRKENPP